MKAASGDEYRGRLSVSLFGGVPHLGCPSVWGLLWLCRPPLTATTSGLTTAPGSPQRLSTVKRGRKGLRLFPGEGCLGEARGRGGSYEQVSEGVGSQCREGEEPPPGQTLLLSWRQSLS